MGDMSERVSVWVCRSVGRECVCVRVCGGECESMRGVAVPLR